MNRNNNNYTKCNTWNHISRSSDWQSCNVCGYKIILKHNALEKAELKEEQRLNNIFLIACNNFNSNKVNLNLLFYGFIHFEIDDINLYENIPMDIIKACIIFSYDINKLETPIADQFNKDYPFNYINKPHKIEFSDNNTILKWEMPPKTAARKKVYGCFEVIHPNCVRRKWKIKILDHDENTPIDVSMGIGCPFMDMLVTDDDNGMHEKTKRFNKDIKNGDVITMLFVYEQKISFKVNGDLVHTMDANITGSIFLLLEINCNITIQLLQD